MKIIFINGILGGDFSALDISLTQLATYINRKTDHDATILDLTFHRKHWKRHMHNDILRNKPDIIAMSCSTLYLKYIKTIAREIKKRYDIPIILGGYHPSIHPESTLNIPEIDAICIGDGEIPLTRFLDKYENGQSAQGIKGIWAKENGKLIKNPGGSFVRDINQFPVPDWDLWKDLKKYFYYLGMLYFLGNRGCPYRCTYCDAHEIDDSVKGVFYRERDPEAYAQEIIYQWNKYQHKGMRFAQLFDQVPTMNQKWLSRFCNEYISKGNPDKYHFSMFSRIDHLNEEKIRLLSKAGCKILRMGVEAGNDNVRNIVHNKNLTKNRISKIFQLCKKYGVGITAFYMIGGPSENRGTINETINYAKKLNATRSAFFIYKPVTKASEQLIKKYGGSIDTKRYRQADNFAFNAVVRLRNISPGQIERLQYKGYFQTFGKRLMWMTATHPISYLPRLSTYVTRGIRDGLDMKYLMLYHHIYGYDYVNK